MNYTSAQANKLLKKLNDEYTALLDKETRSRDFRAAMGEDVESVRPVYDYAETQIRLAELEAKIRKLKHAINIFNATQTVDGFDMTISVPNNYQPHMDTAEVVAEQLREAGINVTIQPVEWSTWLDTIYNGRQFQATVVGVDAANMTARAMLERFTSDYGKNFINYNTPAYDALFQQAINAQDEATQTDLYKQMETMLADTAANVYIQDLCDLVAMRQDLGGLKFYPIYVLDLSTVYLTQR